MDLYPQLMEDALATTDTAELSFERAIAFAADLIRIPSPPGGEGDVAARVADEMRAIGYDSVETDEVGNVIGRIEGRGDAETVMLNSHLDIVDAGDPDGWEHEPFGGELAGGFLHGRGAMDIKGPLALQTYAAASFLEDRPDGDILVAHTVLEERGGWGMAHLMESGRVRPGAIIIGEATNGDVCIGHRGRAELIVELRGEAGHASAPDRARNAMGLLPAVLHALDAFAGTLGSDPVLGASTLAPTDLEAEPASRNVIPDRVRVFLDWRVLPDATADAAVDAVRSALHDRVSRSDGLDLDVRFVREHQRTYTGLEREWPLFTPGFLIERDHPIARAAADAVERATSRAPTIRPWTFATDGGHSCGVHGIPTLGYAPGEERHAHTNRERLDLEQAETAYAAYPAVVRAVQRAATGAGRGE